MANIKISTLNEFCYGKVIGYPWGEVKFDEDGVADISDEVVNNYDISEYGLKATNKGVGQVSTRSEKAEEQPDETTLKKNSIGSGGDSNESEQTGAEQSENVYIEEADKPTEAPVEHGGEKSAKTIEKALILKFQTELNKKNSGELKKLARELSVKPGVFRNMNKSTLVKYLARKIAEK
jgi:hypothetical protein